MSDRIQTFISTVKGRRDIHDAGAPKNLRSMRLFTLVLSVAVPVLTKIYLNAPIGVLAIAALSIPTTALGFASRVRREGFGWLRYLSMALNAGLGAMVLVGILITPLSAYSSWFESFRYGTPDGGVSNLFVVITGYFAATLAPTSLSVGVGWPVVLIGFTLIFLSAIVLQTRGMLILVLGFLVVAAGYLAFRSSRTRREGAFTYTLALLGAAFIIASAVPRFETPPGDEYVNQVLYPRLREAVVDAVPQFPLLYSVPGYGITFDEKKLGGTPTLLPNPIFRISGVDADALYVRSRIFDTYDGTSWSMSSYSAGRNTDALRSRFFGDPGANVDNDIRIEITAKTFGFLPYTLDTDLVIFDEGFPRIAEGNVDTGFKLREPLKRGDVVYLRRNETDPTDVVGLSDTERRLYGQIPDDLPPELRVIADGLSNGITDHPQVLANIEDFLAKNYTYNLEVEEFAPGADDQAYDDFVYSFLFSEDGGYCVQFATSFIILARLNGIPARYATGYLAYRSSSEDFRDVSGLSAHAWPEVWLDEVGWVNWEATPAANIANYSNIGGSWTFNFEADDGSVTSRQIEGLLGTSFDDGEEKRSGSPNIIPFLRILAGAGAATAAAVLLFLLFRVVKRLFRDESGTFYQTARRLSRIATRHGIHPPQKVGWDTWFDTVDGRIHGGNGEVESMRSLVLELTYSDAAVTPEHCEAIARFRKYVAKGLRKSK